MGSTTDWSPHSVASEGFLLVGFEWMHIRHCTHSRTLSYYLLPSLLEHHIPDGNSHYAQRATEVLDVCFKMRKYQSGKSISSLDFINLLNVVHFKQWFSIPWKVVQLWNSCNFTFSLSLWNIALSKVGHFLGLWVLHAYIWKLIYLNLLPQHKPQFAFLSTRRLKFVFCTFKSLNLGQRIGEVNDFFLTLGQLSCVSVKKQKGGNSFWGL